MDHFKTWLLIFLQQHKWSLWWKKWNGIIAQLCLFLNPITHRGRVTHICVGKLTIIDSENGLSPGRLQAIFGTNAGILPIGTIGTNFSEILTEIYTFSFRKMHLKMASAKWRPFCVGLNVLMTRNSWKYTKTLVSVVATDVMVLKHQAISTYTADSIPIVANLE